MLIIFESPNKTGKSTLAKKVADALNIQYIKLNNINVVENESIKDGISISTHSQLETVVQLHEKGVLKDAVLDRFHISEVVYTNLLRREYDISYIEDLEQRLLKHNDILLIRCISSFVNVKKRWADEKLILPNMIKKEMVLYDWYYSSRTKLPFINIDTNESIDTSFMYLMNELNKRGIYKDHLRDRRVTHAQAMMSMAKDIAKRSPCITRQVGCILTEDGYVVGVGYNGPPSGMKHDEIDIRKEKGFKSGEGLDYSRDVHAEQNAMQQSGIRSKRAAGELELFTTASPCIHCMRQLIQIGVSKIYYLELYNHPLALEMAKEAGVEMIPYEE